MLHYCNDTSVKLYSNAHNTMTIVNTIVAFKTFSSQSVKMVRNVFKRDGVTSLMFYVYLM
jgi:hypothetical protein